MSFTFLICSERSGSNLVTSIMNGHPHVSGPPPSHLFRLFGLNAHTYHPTNLDENWNALTRDIPDAQTCMIGEWDSAPDMAAINTACPQRTIAQLFNFLYAQERKTDEQISFVKENYTYLILPFLLSNWPDCRFVYQVRDPRDVAASWVKTRAVPGGVKRAMDVWVKDQSASQSACNQMQPSRRIVRVRYEDLIAETEETANTLCKHLDLAYDPAMLNFYQDPRTRRNAGRTQAWENLAKPVQKNNAQKYKSILSDADIQYVELRCAGLMRTFGYPLDSDAASLDPDRAALETQKLENQIMPGEAATPPSKREQEQREQRQHIIDRIVQRGANR